MSCNLGYPAAGHEQFIRMGPRPRAPRIPWGKNYLDVSLAVCDCCLEIGRVFWPGVMVTWVLPRWLLLGRAWAE